MLSAAATVIQRQFSKELNHYHTAKEHLMTINADHNNIETERIMAMADINIRRSRNTSIEFIESKVRS